MSETARPSEGRPERGRKPQSGAQRAEGELSRSDADWFDGARFGLFVHWGHSSQRGIELSWPLVGGVGALPLSDALPADEYHATAPSFDPKPNAARDWLGRAKRAGMRYA